MAGTASDRGNEQARVRSSESNTYNSGRSDSASKQKPGFTKARRAKDPGHTSAGTTPPKA